MNLVEDIADITRMRHSRQMSELGTMERLKVWARNLKRDVIALWLAARDPRVPWYAKALSAAVAAYALSPIDLIPDFIPILGYLDDLLIVPFGIWAAVKLIPEPIMADLRAKALEHRKPTSKAGLAAVVFIWLAAIALTVWFFGLMERW
ncbi:YkvA family protein [Parasphingorhabdus flavimaris]